MRYGEIFYILFFMEKFVFLVKEVIYLLFYFLGLGCILEGISYIELNIVWLWMFFFYESIFDRVLGWKYF